MFSQPKFWKSRNTYFVNRIYGFIPPRRRSQSKCTKFDSIRKAQLWSPFSKGNWGCWWNKLAPGNTGTFLSLKKYLLSETSSTTFSSGVAFSRSSLSPPPVLWVTSSFFLLFFYAACLSLGFHIVLELSSSPLNCELLTGDHGCCFPPSCSCCS